LSKILAHKDQQNREGLCYFQLAWSWCDHNPMFDLSERNPKATLIKSNQR